MTVTAVLFDLGGVLTAPLGRLLAPWAAGCGTELPQLLVTVMGIGAAGDHPWHRLERGETTMVEFERWLEAENRRRGWRVGLDPLAGVMRDAPLRPAVIRRVGELRRAGYRTALVTNTVREWVPGWRTMMDYDDLFDLVVASCEAGLRKPDPEFFWHTLDRLGGVAPDGAVLLDDLEANIAGARAAGLHGVLVGDDEREALARLDELLGSAGPA